jgi:flagellar basal body rod protein FlgF
MNRSSYFRASLALRKNLQQHTVSGANLAHQSTTVLQQAVNRLPCALR